MYFRGNNLAAGEYSFGLTAEPDGPLRYEQGGKNVAFRWIQRVLNHPENAHLLEGHNILQDLTEDEFKAKVEAASTESGLPQHIREILAEAGRRMSPGIGNDNRFRR